MLGQQKKTEERSWRLSPADTILPPSVCQFTLTTYSCPNATVDFGFVLWPPNKLSLAPDSIREGGLITSGWWLHVFSPSRRSNLPPPWSCSYSVIQPSYVILPTLLGLAFHFGGVYFKDKKRKRTLGSLSISWGGQGLTFVMCRR